MGEYIKHREFQGEEIKLGVVTGSGFENYDIPYPKDMLKEFLYLGFEDYYGGFSKEHNASFLIKVVANFDKMTPSWGHQRTFDELIVEGKLPKYFREYLLSLCDLLPLHREGKEIYVLSSFYHDEVLKEAKERGLSVKLIPYEYQHKSEWIQTDELQFVRKNSENRFTVIETTIFEGGYVVQEVDVDIRDYTNEDLEKTVRGYYGSLDDVKKNYENDWKQIVAEIIAEQTPINDETDVWFDNEEDLSEYLRNAYNIELEIAASIA